MCIYPIRSISVKSVVPPRMLSLIAMWEIAIGAHRPDDVAVVTGACVKCGEGGDDIRRCGLCLMTWHAPCATPKLAEWASASSFEALPLGCAAFRLPEVFQDALCAVCVGWLQAARQA